MKWAVLRDYDNPIIKTLRVFCSWSRFRMYEVIEVDE